MHLWQFKAIKGAILKQYAFCKKSFTRIFPHGPLAVAFVCAPKKDLGFFDSALAL